jgi:hypothetical protein
VAIIVAGISYAIPMRNTQSKSLNMLLTYVSQTLIMSSTFGLAFFISHFIYFILIFPAPVTSKGHRMDKQLMTVSLRICHLPMREYISHHGANHTSDGLIFPDRRRSSLCASPICVSYLSFLRCDTR